MTQQGVSTLAEKRECLIWGTLEGRLKDFRGLSPFSENSRVKDI